MITRRSWLVYGMLGALWALLIAWQVIEHVRVHQGAQSQLIDRGRDISTTCGSLMRAVRFFGVISKERLETALNQIVHSTNQLESVVLLNAAGQKVAEAGAPFDLPSNEELRQGVRWAGRAMTLEIPVDLGTNVTPELAQTNLSLVIPEESLRAFRTNRPPRRDGETNEPPGRGREGRRLPDLRFNRPPWMSEAEYHDLLQKAGVHSFVIVMSADPVAEADNYDFWVRVVIAGLGTLGAAGFGLAWRNMTKTSELQLRLVRASELNTHLKEMNLAAAGLAHETRNPLNIIRGLAHLIAKRADAPEVREKSTDIINQTDRVTAQLNEFINYSRPREVRRAPTDLSSVVNEVVRTLAYDIEEKKIQVQTQVEPIIIEADEQLLRQALFNLVLNAIQAVPADGAIRLRASRRNNEEGFIEISDTGPGVSPENRGEIFKPYFTTNQEGTGLGLSIVQQIILAHGWDIECLPNDPKGALFRISHLKLKG